MFSSPLDARNISGGKRATFSDAFGPSSDAIIGTTGNRKSHGNRIKFLRQSNNPQDRLKQRSC